MSPPPNEPHLLGAVLVGDLFAKAGWSVQAEFPHTDPELMGLVSDHWFDALALTLSDVFTRRERLAALMQTIKDVRAAAKNPQMAVFVDGRAFRPSQDEVIGRVGADVHYTSASHAVEDLDYWLFLQRFTSNKPVTEATSSSLIMTTHDVLRAILPELERKASETQSRAH